MSTNDLVCVKGISVSRCIQVQPIVGRNGESPFFCHQCRAEDVFSSAFLKWPIGEALNLARGLGLPFSPSGSLVFHEEARCVYTNMPVSTVCSDRGCLSWIDKPSFHNCAVVFRQLRGTGLSNSDISLMYGYSRSEVKKALSDAEWALKKITLSSVVDDDEAEPNQASLPDWIRTLEADFRLSIRTILQHISIEEIAKQEGLDAGQRSVLRSIASN